MKDHRITIRAVAWGILFSALFAVLTVYAENFLSLVLTACQIPVLPYLLLILSILLINPICRLTRIIRPFTVVEILVVFIMGAVSSSVATFGLADALIPIVGNLFNSDWNNKQSEWNRYVTPFVNEAYFVAVPGIQGAAQEYHQALEDWSVLKKRCDTARRFQDEQIRVAAAAADLQKAEADPALPAAKKAVLVSSARAALANARKSCQAAEAQWLTLRAQGLINLAEVLQVYPARVQQADARADAAEARLAKLQQQAFAKIKVYRRGLPRRLAAYPGVFPMPEDDLHSYFGRYQRLVKGLVAVRELKQALARLDRLPPAAPPDAAALVDINRRLMAASAELQPLGDNREWLARKAAFRQEEDLLAARRLELEQRLKQVNEEKRNAQYGAVRALENQADDLASDIKKQGQRQQKLASRREVNEWQLTCASNVQALADEIRAVQQQIQTQPPAAKELKTKLSALLPLFASVDISLRGYFIGEVPWSYWVGPVSRWLLLIGMTYVVLMSLNVLIFRQWAHNEKLTYPLAELPKALVGGVEGNGYIPQLFGSGLFWAGAALSGIIMSWNLLCATNVIPGLEKLDLIHSWWPYVLNTQFEALGGVRSEVFFTMIGLSFLIPKNISFSLWFFQLAAMFQLLLMVWTGQGIDARSFPTNWWYLLNFQTAEGQGAVIVFSSVMLYKCRKYILCALRPATVADLEPDERKELRLASLAFIGCSIGVIVQLSWGMGASLGYTIFCYVLIILITIGMVRAVTEGGLLAVKTYVSPFHALRAFFGLDQKWTSASLFVPLMIYYGIMFLDIKAFIAPQMANALKIRDDFKMRRGVFHLAIALAIIAAALTAIAAILMLAYAHGADTMSSWFHIGMPKNFFGNFNGMIKDPPVSAPTSALWLSVGAIVMAALLYLRQFLFWLPHPLGMVMLVNPAMPYYWFSILLGWLGNVLVTKYGNQDAYRRACGFFIGLIVGELVIVILSMIVSMVMGMPIRIDLNRL